MTPRNDEIRAKNLIVPKVTEEEIQKITMWLENEMNLYCITILTKEDK